MAYHRTRTITEVSDYSDYSNATVLQTEDTQTAVLVQRFSPSMTVPTAGITLTASGAATVWTRLIVENTDTSNYVAIAYTSVGSAGSVTLRVLAGQTISIGSGEINHSGNITLTANTGAVICNVVALES